MEGYCMKCRAKREIKDPVAGFNKRGSAVVEGKCSVCGTKIYRIGKTELHEGMEAPKKQFFLGYEKQKTWNYPGFFVSDQ